MGDEYLEVAKVDGALQCTIARQRRHDFDLAGTQTCDDSISAVGASNRVHQSGLARIEAGHGRTDDAGPIPRAAVIAAGQIRLDSGNRTWFVDSVIDFHDVVCHVQRAGSTDGQVAELTDAAAKGQGGLSAAYGELVAAGDLSKRRIAAVLSKIAVQGRRRDAASVFS